MKLVIQRVKEAKVTVEGKTVGEISKGLFILLGIGADDKPEYSDILAEKVINMRLMSDKFDKMNLSVKEANGEILVVSQFTLYADTSGGRRPSFVKAAQPEFAKEIYEKFIESLRKNEVKVETGKFGHYMKIETALDGPVTIILSNLKTAGDNPRMEIAAQRASELKAR